MRTSRPLLLALVGAQVAYPRVPEARRDAATRGVVALMTLAAAVEAAEARGPRRAAGLLGAAAGVGFAAELVGVRTGRPFGAYRYSGGLGPRVAGVPVLAGACWAMMARPAWVVAGHAVAPGARRRRIAVAAWSLAAWDVFLDPRMVRDGYWTWTRGGRYEDVPASNFAGWLGVAAVLFALWAAADGEEAGAGDDGALALYLWTWVGEVLANAAIWRRPRVAVAGGVAMGLVAGPALAGRLRLRG